MIHVAQTNMTLTGEYVLVDACELDICLGRIGHDETVDNTLGDGLRDGMPQQTHDLDGCCFRGEYARLGRLAVENIGKRGLADDIQRSGWVVDDVRGPAVDQPLELRCGALCAIFS